MSPFRFQLSRVLAAAALLFGIAGAACAQSADVSAARCRELASNANADFQRRLRAMAPTVSPSGYVEDNYGVNGILSEKISGGSFFGIDIGSVVGGLTSQFLGGGKSSGGGNFGGSINGVLNQFGSPGFLSGSGAQSYSAPASTAQPGFFQKLFGSSSSSASTQTPGFNPYQR